MFRLQKGSDAASFLEENVMEQLMEKDQMILRIARDQPVPMAEAWRAVGNDVSYAGFNHRCDRLIRAGALHSFKQYGRRFIQASPEARS